MIMDLKDRKISFTGEIKVDNDYGYFAMETNDVRQKLEKPLEELNKNIQQKGLKGTLIMCKFTDYGGKEKIK